MVDDRSLNAAENAAGSFAGARFSRRGFLKATSAAGGGLLLSFSLPALLSCGEASEKSGFAPNAFIRIDRDGRVTLVMHKVEMGQGTYTSMPMLIAEELEVDLGQVHLEHAPPNDKLYAEPLFGVQETGGSTSVRGNWEPLRYAGATARSMLVAAAAQTWKVDATSCYAERGEVIHGPTGRRLGYGALVDRAAALPVPRKVALKHPKDFKLIGTPVRRLDAPDKVRGTAQFGIDVRIPGMTIATVAACPVFGGRLASVNESPAMPFEPDQPVTTRADVGVGRLKVLVPKGVTVELSVDVGVGDIQLPGDDRQDVDVAPGKHKELTLKPPKGTKSVGTLDLDLDVGIGQAEVRRAAS